ncbi:hypothetical protein NX059_012377 [Plenodomus lindquistii]|nr:hypothetical protein NX059_012377 [Plenodomus lindquistii]
MSEDGDAERDGYDESGAGIVYWAIPHRGQDENKGKMMLSIHSVQMTRSRRAQLLRRELILCRNPLRTMKTRMISPLRLPTRQATRVQSGCYKDELAFASGFV